MQNLDKEKFGAFVAHLRKEKGLTQREVAERLAVRYGTARGIFDYVELTPEYGIYEIELPHGWAGHSILERQVRTRHNINILAIRHGRNLFPMPGPEHVFTEGETLMVMGSERDIKALMR